MIVVASTTTDLQHPFSNSGSDGEPSTKFEKSSRRARNPPLWQHGFLNLSCFTPAESSTVKALSLTSANSTKNDGTIGELVPPERDITLNIAVHLD